MKHHDFLELLPPRPTFAQDMNEPERGVMQQHVAYWADLLKQGITIVYGPMTDPAGAYGVGVIEVESDERLRKCIDNDPANGLNRYEWFPMHGVTHTFMVKQWNSE